MRGWRWVWAVSVVLVLPGCGSDDEASPPPRGSSSKPAAAATPTGLIPDAAGRLVAPEPTGSDRLDKAWLVPDATGLTDRVSAADADYLAATRPAVPYSAPTTSNLTLIAIGKKACSPASSYQAGGVTVSGPAAEVVHRAALKAYC